jgi:pimeloyl-ACP methyl ester carboxylesterase
MRATLARLVALASGLLLACAAVACANHAIAPGHDEPTPPNDTENVSVVISGDVILNGRLFGGDNLPVVILSHMRQNDQTAWFDFAQELAGHGYAALTFDFRGYGQSTGKQDFDKLDEDLAAVIQYMRDRGKTEIFLVGASMGATTSLVLAGESRVKAVVALSPPAKFESQDALHAVPDIHVPKLFVASEGDAPALQFAELYAAAADPKEEALYPGTAHGTDLLRADKNDQASAVDGRIIDFLDKHR